MPTKPSKRLSKKLVVKKEELVLPKKTPAKKKVAKKKAVKAKKHSVTKIVKDEMPLVGMVEHVQTGLNHEVENPAIIPHTIQKRFVFVGTCSNCEHLPMSVGSLVGLMSFLVTVLSGIVVAQMNPSSMNALLVKAQNVVPHIQTIVQK